MGWNSTIVVMNDALDGISKDSELGRKIDKAISSCSFDKQVDISCGPYVRAMTVIETHHADNLVPVLLGGNTGHKINDIWLSRSVDDSELDLLKKLAHKLGYRLSKKPKNK